MLCKLKVLPQAIGPAAKHLQTVDVAAKTLQFKISARKAAVDVRILASGTRSQSPARANWSCRPWLSVGSRQQHRLIVLELCTSDSLLAMFQSSCV